MPNRLAADLETEMAKAPQFFLSCANNLRDGFLQTPSKSFLSAEKRSWHYIDLIGEAGVTC